MPPAIKVENLSKQYRLGQIGTGSISHDINRWWHTIRGKEDPYLKIGETNDRTKAGQSEYVWSLKDINFTIEQGDAVGIIGRNGAGKSTLLKILSRVTAPTTGSVKAKGRIASLLEVGTGFHPELSGRENIFLNGAILGMRKHEIKRKFDEIVDFAGVERYIDTPVKRYSSGMYVRLAFAVAAYLESEILIVDEVLAVGDAEFQKKCLGKMGEVSKGEGRTVLFVSHNMEAIFKLCQTSILMHNGQMRNHGNTSDVLNVYLRLDKKIDPVLLLSDLTRPIDVYAQDVRFREISLLQKGSKSWAIQYKEPLKFRIQVEVFNFLEELEVGIALYTRSDFEVISSLSTDNHLFEKLVPGIYEVEYSFGDLSLLPGIYKVGLGLRSEKKFEDYLPFVVEFEVLISDQSASAKTGTRLGILVPEISAKIDKIN